MALIRVSSWTPWDISRDAPVVPPVGKTTPPTITTTLAGATTKKNQLTGNHITNNQMLDHMTHKQLVGEIVRRCSRPRDWEMLQDEVQRLLLQDEARGCLARRLQRQPTTASIAPPCPLPNTYPPCFQSAGPESKFLHVLTCQHHIWPQKQDNYTIVSS